MSIDTDDSELDILQAFDFSKRCIRLLSIEHDNTPQQAKVDQLLARQNFRPLFPAFSPWDGWYVY